MIFNQYIKYNFIGALNIDNAQSIYQLYFWISYISIFYFAVPVLNIIISARARFLLSFIQYFVLYCDISIWKYFDESNNINIF